MRGFLALSLKLPVRARKFFSLGLAGLLLLFPGCKSEPDSGEEPLLRLLPPEVTGVTFRNQLFENDRLNILTWEYFYNGGGVGVGDFDNDGLVDLFFSANMLNSALYRNQGDWQFEDRTQSAGIHTRGQWAAGVSVVDINADGWLDIYVCMAGPYPAAERANQLYINQGDFTFREQAAAFGLADTGHSTQAAFFDYDRDGDLDCYLLTNMMEELGPNVIRPKKTDGSGISNDRLYRNDGGTFVNVTQAAGIQIEGYGLGLSVVDANEDGWPDLYVSNDYLSNDLLWINQQDGTFRDEAARYFRHTSYSAMGHDVGDINRDGRPDIVTVDMLPPDNRRQKLMFGATNYDRFQSEIRSGYSPQYMRNTLQLHQGLAPNGDPIFAEIGQLAGVHQTDWSWGAWLADLDLDGWQDLLITNGYPRDITNRDFADYKAGVLFGGEAEVDLGQLAQALGEIEGVYLPNYAFRNQGDLTFRNASQAWGFTQPSYSHGLALADLDGDGDLDLVVNNLEDPAFLYENTAAQRPDLHWLAVDLEGKGHNLSAIGTKVVAWQHGQQQVVWQHPVRGFQSSYLGPLHLGGFAAGALDSLIITWPDGSQSRQSHLAVDQQHRFSWADSHPAPVRPKPAAPNRRFQARATFPDLQHHDPLFPDFDRQPLLPHKHSELGPALTTGDFNQDGWEDAFLGGGKHQPGQLLLSSPKGEYRAVILAPDHTLSEQVAAAAFDADQDGDLDLYVVNGSSEWPAGHAAYQDQLYLNDGYGQFLLAQEALPELRSSGSCVVPFDWDQDGDLDVFVGGRVTPDSYPTIPRSYLLENVGGRFLDVTDKAGGDLATMGLVTDACAADWNQDGRPDLIVVGEWMPIQIWLNQGGGFGSPLEVPDSRGWWNCVAVVDADQDGVPDLFAGNLGYNSRLKASPEQPLRLYAKDLNRDGREEAILTWYLQDQEVTLAARDDLLRQLTYLKRRFPSYQRFAARTWQDLLSPAEREGMRSWEVQQLGSCYVAQGANGELRLQPLPLLAQVAPVFDLLPGDWNGDGHLDLLLCGNSEAAEVQTGYYDAMRGLLLCGDGQGHFTAQLPSESGFYVPGNGRRLRTLVGPQGRYTVLAAQQNGPLLAFRWLAVP